MKFVKTHITFLTVFMLFAGDIAFAQNAYIQTDIIRVAGATNDAAVNALTLSGKTTTRQYLDGIGAPVQTVALQEGASNNNDIIQVAQYDGSGRMSIKYLPYVDDNGTYTSGSYRSTGIADQQSYYANNSIGNNLNKVANDPLPFSQELFENSPLHRLLGEGATGAGFQPDLQDNSQHYSTISYRTNTASDQVVINPVNSGTVFYPQNVLSVTDAKNADNVETLMFKNSMGQILLKRQMSGQSTEPYYDTYYIYNPNGSLEYIIPPKASHLIVSGTNTNIQIAPLSNLIYAYTYDVMGRIITKKIPNEGTINLIYDPMNRPVLVQDGNKAATNQWYYIKYDADSRPVSQGIYTDATNTGQYKMQQYVNTHYGTNYNESRSSIAATMYYTNICFPFQNIQPLAFVFYDDYDLTQAGSSLYKYQGQGLVDGSGNNIEATPVAYTHGKLTMVLKCSVGSGLSAIWLTTVNFYDKHGNIIQIQSNNHLNLTPINVTPNNITDYRTIAPDFTGKPLQVKVTKVTGSGSANTNTVLSTYSYDTHNERIQSIVQAYNGQAPITVANYAYNEIGQLVTKNLGLNTTTSAYLQTLDYRYNIRGQLLTINNSTLSNDGGITNNDNKDLFGMTYLYDGTDPSLANDHPSYTGRISAVKWMHKYTSGTTTGVSNERSYVYRYDQLGQLISALYAERLPPPSSTYSTPFTLNLDGFDEKSITYDDDGNITGLQRYASATNGTGGTALDRLKYSYDPQNPDRLIQVADTVTATGEYGFNNIGNIQQEYNYQYDANGNLRQDPYKNISISYNAINKIDVITASGIGNSTINYTYDASGTVLKKQVYQNGVLQTTSSMDYIDEFVYINGALSYFSMPEGRVVSSGGTFKPEYIITDQQGNSRFSFQDNGSGSPLIVQENSYYGFGEVMPGSLVAQPALTTANNNIYDGSSEWQNIFGNLPDYYQSGSRNYDPELGRFIGVDPMAEMTESLTNYHYAGNNPIMHNDPSGNCDDCTIPGQWVDPGVGNDFGGTNNGDPTATGGGGGGDPNTGYDNGVSTSSSSFGGIYNNGNTNNTTSGQADGTNQNDLQTTSGNSNNGDSTEWTSYSVTWNPLVTSQDQNGNTSSNSEVINNVSANGTLGEVVVNGNQTETDNNGGQGSMSLSAQGLAFIKAHEGFVGTPYDDGPHHTGNATIGYGHLIHYGVVTDADVAKYGRITRAEGLLLLQQDLVSRIDAVNNLVHVPLTQYQFDAIVSFTYNAGAGNANQGTGLAGSQFLNQLNQSNYDGNLMMHFHSPATVIGRRQDEINLFMHDEY